MNKMLNFLVATIILSSMVSSQGSGIDETTQNIRKSGQVPMSNVAQNSLKAGAAINLGHTGFIGILFMIVFFLVLIIFFNLILQSGDFNYKFVKEKMPLGKEY
jgi:hypothetical protein